MQNKTPFTIVCSILLFLLLLPFPEPAAADLVLGPVEFVEADSGQIQVPGYSVPSFTFWDGDSLKDLIVGEGGTTPTPGKVRIYLNGGSETEPHFSSFSYAQSEGSDLVVLGGG